jgi:pimeloyl-ACP methyl ester carboxylesterase
MAELEGVTAERVSQIVPLLPYVLEETPPAPGELRDYSFSDATVTANYSVVLPLEYHSQHRYPLLVILRRSQQSTTDAIRMWAGNANEPGYTMRRGYIAISPEYTDGKVAKYEYSAAGHRQVMAAINDARKKFAVDSDRIYIVGHEMGGDAAIDMALAHPDVFAGAAPFLPQPQGYAIRTWESALLLPWYFVGGQRDRDSMAHIASFVDRLAGKRVSDFVYCEYKARGEEIYSEEFNRLFDWMQTYRRRTLAEVKNDWRMEVMRPTDDHCFWIVSGGLPAKLSEPIVWDKPKTIPAAMEMRSKITMGNEMYVWHPGSHVQIWLSPEMIDFDKRFRVESKGRRFNDFVKPSIATMLEDFQMRGDRERLWWAKVEL